METCDIKIDGYTLRYYVEGDESAPAILMLHGWVSFHGVWRTTIPRLKTGYRCITVDLLGFGDSDKPASGDYSIHAHAERVLKVADTLGINKFTLMGHSMGGQIALYIAACLATGRVNKLINVDGVASGKLTYETQQAIRLAGMGQMFAPIYLSARLWYQTRLYASLFNRTFFHDFDAVPLEFWQEDRYRTIQPGADKSAYRAGKAIRDCDLSHDLNKITCPVLTIFGKQDRVVPISEASLVANRVPNHRLKMIDKCGHFPMYEKPDEYLATVEAFLAE